jgi:hypothetical protein
MAAGGTAAEPQDDALANYAEKLSKEEARIDWSMDAAAIERCIRAFNPWPISWFDVAGQTVKVAGRSRRTGSRPGSRHPAQGRQAGDRGCHRQGDAPADPATSRQEGHVRFGSAQLAATGLNLARN